MENNSNLKAYDGTLAGVPGRLAWAGSSYAFTRTLPGTAVAVPGPAAFIPPTPHRDAITLLWMGKNNLGTAGADETVISLTDRTFDWLSPLVTRAVVLGHFMDTNHAANSLEREQLRIVNEAHRRRYGNQFIDVQAYVTGTQIWTDTGITPTAEDRAQQTIGNMPPSLARDPQHLNAAGLTALTQKIIIPCMSGLGWF